MNAHRTSVRQEKNTIFAQHFKNNDIFDKHFSKNDGCKISHIQVQPIEASFDLKNKTKRLQREAFWIRELQTLAPYGLNDRLGAKNWRFRSRNDIAGVCFNRKKTFRGRRGKGKNKQVHQSSEDFINQLAVDLPLFPNWRAYVYKYVNSLDMKSVIDLSWKFAQFYHNGHTKLPKYVTDMISDMTNYRISMNNKKEKNVERKTFLKL